MRLRARLDGFAERLTDALGNISGDHVIPAAPAHLLAHALTVEHFIQTRGEAFIVMINVAAPTLGDVVGEHFGFGARQHRRALGHCLQGHDAETFLAGRHHVDVRAGHQAEFFFRRNETTKINVLVIWDRDVVFSGQYQPQRGRTFRLEANEIIKELRAALIWIDPATVQQVRIVQPGGLARFGVDGHRDDPARQFSPQTGSQPAFGFR